MAVKQACFSTGNTGTWSRPSAQDTSRAAPILAWKMCAYNLRHSFASMAAGVGLSSPVIGALLGHRHAATTARYSHLAANPLKVANGLIGKR